MSRIEGGVNPLTGRSASGVSYRPAVACESNCILAFAALPFESEENITQNSVVHSGRCGHVCRPCPTGAARYLDPFESAGPHDSESGSQPNRAALVQRCAGLGGEDIDRKSVV